MIEYLNIKSSFIHPAIVANYFFNICPQPATGNDLLQTGKRKKGEKQIIHWEKHPCTKPSFCACSDLPEKCTFALLGQSLLETSKGVSHSPQSSCVSPACFRTYPIHANNNHHEKAFALWRAIFIFAFAIFCFTKPQNDCDSWTNASCFKGIDFGTKRNGYNRYA